MKWQSCKCPRSDIATNSSYIETFLVNLFDNGVHVITTTSMWCLWCITISISQTLTFWFPLLWWKFTVCISLHQATTVQLNIDTVSQFTLTTYTTRAHFFLFLFLNQQNKKLTAKRLNKRKAKTRKITSYLCTTTNNNIINVI